MTRQMKCTLSGVALALTVILADQLSKWYVVTQFFAGADKRGFGAWLTQKAPQVQFDGVRQTAFWNTVLVWNPGVSFGMLQTDRTWVSIGLTIMALAVAAGFLVWLWREPKPFRALAIGMIVGGALGNVWDRLRFGAVVDFIDLHLAEHHWPSFNIADAGVTIGITLILIETVFFSAKPNYSDRSVA